MLTFQTCCENITQNWYINMYMDRKDRAQLIYLQFKVIYIYIYLIGAYIYIYSATTDDETEQGCTMC